MKMKKRRLVLYEESCDEMEGVTLNQASAVTLNQTSAAEEVHWAWKREDLPTRKVKFYLHSRRAIIKQIADELKLTGDEVYHEFQNSCFGFLMRFDSQGISSHTALHFLFTRAVTKADASPDELWYRIGKRFVRFSKYEFALVTGLSFRPTTFDPSAEHDPPASGLFLRYYQGQSLTMDALRLDFSSGVFRESPSDALKVAKLLIVYFLLFGMKASTTYIDHWAWTLIEDTDRWETFMWGKYTYQILLKYLNKVSTGSSYSLKRTHRVQGYIWAFLIWAYEAIPELANTCGVLAFDDVLPRCLPWRFLKGQVDMNGFCDRQMEVHSTLEPSAEEQRQPYWEHIHDDLQSGVCYKNRVNPIKKTKKNKKKKKPSASPSPLDVLPISEPQGPKPTRTRRSHSTSAAHVIRKRRRIDPLTIIQEEVPSVIRKEVLLALEEFFSRRDSLPPLHIPGEAKAGEVGHQHCTIDPVSFREMENPSMYLDSEPKLSNVAVNQAGGINSIFELNEKIKELKNKNLENDRFAGVREKKYKCLDKMVVKMGQEIEDLRHEKLAAVKIIEELKRENIEANKTIEELRLKKSESDKEAKLYKSRLENVSPTIGKMEEDIADMLTVKVGNPAGLVNDVLKFATSKEGGNLNIPGFKGEKDNIGNVSTPDDAENVVVLSSVRSASNSTGSRNCGLLKEDDINSTQPWTREDDAHTVKTSPGSQSLYNPHAESNGIVKDNEHREPQGSGAHASGTRLNDEYSTDSDESYTDSRMDDFVESLRSEKLGRECMYEADMLRAFQQDEQLCMNAVCALYRQQFVARKLKGGSNLSKNGGFSPVDSISGCALAEYLIDGNKELRLKKSVSEVNEERPDVIGQCRKLANIYIEKLFAIYCSGDDPLFWQ